MPVHLNRNSPSSSPKRKKRLSVVAASAVGASLADAIGRMSNKTPSGEDKRTDEKGPNIKFKRKQYKKGVQKWSVDPDSLRTQKWSHDQIVAICRRLMRWNKNSRGQGAVIFIPATYNISACCTTGGDPYDFFRATAACLSQLRRSGSDRGMLDITNLFEAFSENSEEYALPEIDALFEALQPFVNEDLLQRARNEVDVSLADPCIKARMNETGSMRSHPLALKLANALDSFASEHFRPDLFEQVRSTNTDDIKCDSGDEEEVMRSSSDSADDTDPLRPPGIIRFGQNSLFAGDPSTLDALMPDVVPENTNFTRDLAEAIFASLPQSLPNMS